MISFRDLLVQLFCVSKLTVELIRDFTTSHTYFVLTEKFYFFGGTYIRQYFADILFH